MESRPRPLEERGRDPLARVQVDQSDVPDPEEVLAMLVHELGQPRVLVLDVALDEEGVGQEDIGNERIRIVIEIVN